MSQYEYVRNLGAGHFGHVDLEWDRSLDRMCAAKYVTRQIDTDEFSEARAMEVGRHDNVVSVYSADLSSDGHPVIRMEYLERGSLADYLRGEACPIRSAVKMLETACRGIARIHAVGFLHRDIKPANMLLTSNDEVKVSDFGLACARGAALETGIAYWPHLPPESISEGRITTAKGDLYALGASAFRILNGDIRVRSSILNADTSVASETWLPHIPMKLRACIAKAMHANPGSRFEGVEEFRRALEAARPRVDWQMSELAPDELEWSGAGFDGKVWSASFRKRKRVAKWEFDVKVSVGGKSPRSRGSDKLLTDDRAVAFRHAEKVLQRIAMSGE
ncbi:serine/threonine-protein kinase [Tsukamurella strandjordii]|uniref:serine/threonine-protein kinase n=1 Tax=Tsukamurella strandjordii TaxID=147577 RepID=UPI0031E34C92